MELKFETIGLSDLKALKSLLEERIKGKDSLLDKYRGRDFYAHEEELYEKEILKNKLVEVDKRIEEYINII